MLPIAITQLILSSASFASAGVNRILDISVFTAVNLNIRIAVIILSPLCFNLVVIV